LLADRASAIRRHDRTAFLATVDDRSPGLRKRQAAWFDNLADVPLSSWDHKLVATDREPPRPGRASGLSPAAFTATVQVEYRLAGHDPVPQRFAQQLTFDQRDGRWLIAGDPAGSAMAALSEAAGGSAGASQPPQLWDFGPVRTVPARHGLVLGLAAQQALREYAREIDSAVPAVADVWPGEWSRRVVLIAPRTDEQLAALLGGQPTQYSRLAAITRGELGTSEDRAPADRVFVNPNAFSRLSPVGRQVIMAHEITHVATRADTKPWTPKWLSEGFADYVGYRNSGLATPVVAQELAADVRRGRLPAVLPPDEAFHGTRRDLPQVYEASWLACRLIAQRYGERALTGFYRAVAQRHVDGRANGIVDRAFRERLGSTQERFTAEWRAYIQRLLR
jgi:hypothetical protein